MAGRPEFKPTSEQRAEVTILAASRRFSEKEMAAAFGIDEKTLRKHFRDELDTGFAKFNCAVIYKFGQKLITEPKKSDCEWWFSGHGTSIPTEDNAVTKPKLGKKELKVVDANQAGLGTDWESLLKPRQVPN